MSMADLLAKQENKTFKIYRNQELEGEIVAINDSEIILDLGSKSEGVLPKRDLTPEQIANLKIGDKLITFVVTPENESGQVILTMQKVISSKSGNFSSRWQKFQDALKNNQVLSGKGLEVNKGGLVVEVSGIRGFLPSSQVALSNAAEIDKLVGQDLNLSVIEVDPSQNRLIFTQKIALSEEDKKKLAALKVGETVKGKVAAILPFGIFVTLEGDNQGIEGLVHSGEISWEKTEDPGKDYKINQEVEAKVLSVEPETGRVNLSLRQLSEDPFAQAAKKYQVDDVIKITIDKVNETGAFAVLEGGIEGLLPANRFEPGVDYKPGESMTVLVDTVDTNKRRVLLSPMLTSTKDLIYK